MDDRVATLDFFHEQLYVFPIRQLFAVLIVANLGVQEYNIGIHALRLEARFLHQPNHLVPIVVVQRNDDSAEKMSLLFGKCLDLACFVIIIIFLLLLSCVMIPRERPMSDQFLRRIDDS